MPSPRFALKHPRSFPTHPHSASRRPVARPAFPFHLPKSGLSRLAGIMAAAGLLACAGAQAADPAAAASPAPSAASSATPAAPAEKQPPLSPKQAKLQGILKEVNTLFSKRQLEQASDKLKEAEQIDPEDEGVLSAKAAILAESDKVAEARAIYTKLAAAHPGSFVPQFNLAELFSIEKKYGEARTAFEALLKKFPDNDFLQFKIILTYLAEGNQKDAAAWFEKLKRPQPTPFMIYAAAALAIEGGNISGGKALILTAEKQFGAGRQQLLHDSLADLGIVLQGDYPPRADAP